MFDLTLYQEDKDSYIVDVYMNDNNTYTIKFASGREETFEFSIHNFQVELYRMEEQFNQYGKDYLENVFPMRKFRTGILGLLLVVDIMTFKNLLENGFTFSGVWCLAYGTYVLLCRVIPHIKQRKLYVEAKKKIAILKKYLENKEQFKVEVINPVTDKEEDWYLIDMGNIDQFDSEKDFEIYMSELTSEKKEEEAQKLTKLFKTMKEGNYV